MRNLICLLVSTLLMAPAFAITQPRFLPLDRNAMVAIRDSDISGASDGDATRLYEQMNVPEQDSSLGKGKSIKTEAKDFTLVCSKEKKLCSIILNKTANTVISGAKKYASYEITGAIANELLAQFHLTDKGDFAFTATDGIFHIHVVPGAFIFEIQAP